MNSVSKGLVWKIFERFGVLGTQFVLQIVLARILDPAHYGVLSLMLVFTMIANVFIQSGFNTSLIQNKDVTDDDFSSVFWVSLFISVILYIIIFISAPFIGKFYDMPGLTAPLRVISLVLLPGAFNSVQLAKVNRDMDFKKVFLGNILGVVISGIIGIVLAYSGFGLWSLVAQNMLNIIVCCLVMVFIVDWHPKFIINWQRINVLFKFGWKILVSSLIDTVFTELRSLVIGKQFDEKTLGYYNKGKQFPQFLINGVNGAVQSVLLPALSKLQDDIAAVKELTRKSIIVGSYLLFPIMAILAGVARPLVIILLTDKWLPCVPYLQIYCLTLAFYPIHACNLQAINAVGRSDVFLKLELFKKFIGVLALIIVVVFFKSPIAIAISGVFTTLISTFINAFPNKKFINYTYLQQVKDILPSLILSTFVFLVIYLIQFIKVSNFLIIIIQVLVAVIIYLGISALLKLRGFKLSLDIVLGFIKKK
ncbi:MAG: lipopolysaccharide biosynthesis protein [Acutalibacteraceae bacterium]|nr:lipopolysaccharide biosynthesis protein [Acutalibacteraceae bacterium]